MVLPVPVGRSLYARLCVLAQAEGLDPVTLIIQMVAYQAGVSSARAGDRRTGPAERPDLAARHAIVCMLCGREAPSAGPRPSRCEHCGGQWVNASA
jgi:hypothetical protein